VGIKDNELYPLTDDTAAKISAYIKSYIPSTPQTRLTRDEVALHCNLQVPDEYRERYIDIMFKHQDAISLDKYDLRLARNYKHKIHLKKRIRSIENNSKYLRPTISLLRKPWKNG
jgi:hypothetical protein